MGVSSSAQSQTPQSSRELHEFSAGDRLFIAVAIVAVGILWIFVGGAWLAARVTGTSLGVAGQQAIEVIARVPEHWTNPAAAWPEPARSRLPGPVLYWLCTASAAAPLVLVGWWWARRERRRRLGLEKRIRLGVDAEARMATLADIAPIVVSGPEPGRMILGHVHGRLVATENPAPRPTRAIQQGRPPTYRPARGAVCVVGPSQSGKSALLVPAILDWQGAVLASSVKVDLIDETYGWRSTRGECRVYDPCRVTGLTPASWSPLRGAETWIGAQRAAHAVRSCAPVSTGPNATFFDGQMEQLLAGYFWVAAHYGYGMRDVVRWIATEDSPGDSGDGEVATLCNQALLSDDPDVAEDASFAFETLRGIWSLQDRTRADVFATGRGSVWPWSNRDVVGTSRGCDLSLDWLLAGSDGRANTMYVAAPLADAERLKPAIGGVIGDIVNQLMMRYTQTGKPLDPPLLLVLDEIGNTPLRELPRLVSTLSGLGVQLVTSWQSIAQMHKEYGEAAGTVIANHRTKVFFSGISDGVTGEVAAKMLGDEQVLSRQVSSELGQFDGGRRSLSESLITTSIIPAHVLREQMPGSALLVHGTIPPAHLTVRSQFSDSLLLERASIPVPRFNDPPRAAPSPAHRPAAAPADGGCETPARPAPSQAAPKLRVITGE
jgi:type IV secretion system protein VirD4